MQVVCSTSLPKGYTGPYWTSTSNAFGVVYHYYGKAIDVPTTYPF